MLFGCVDKKIKHKEEVNMKTYKSMLSVVCCWCLCLSLCSFSFAENTSAEKPSEVDPALQQQQISNQEIALQKQKEKEKAAAKAHANQGDHVCEESKAKASKKSKVIQVCSRCRYTISCFIANEV